MIFSHLHIYKPPTFSLKYSPLRQQGVVIVIALFIVALVAVMSYTMMARLERDTRRTTLLLHDIQADLYAEGGVVWAIDALRQNWINQQPGRQIDPLPMRSPVNQVNGYTVMTTIEDMQARFNLNSLTDAEMQKNFSRLMMMVLPELGVEKTQEIVLATVDWITPSAVPTTYDAYYMGLAIPYRAAHRPMQSTSEWRLVKGVNADIFEAMQPYLMALPTATSVNVQTATIPVLMSMADAATWEVAQALVKLRQTTPFVSMQQFSNIDIVKNHPGIDKKAVVSSQYFLVETDVKIENQQLVIYTLLERVPDNKNANINILWQSKGSW